MRQFAIFASLAAAVALVCVTLAPSSADAGWRRKAWQNGYYSQGYSGRRFVAPGPYAYVRPRAGYYAPRTCYGVRYGCGAYPYAYYPYWRQRTQRGWYY